MGKTKDEKVLSSGVLRRRKHSSALVESSQSAAKPDIPVGLVSLLNEDLIRRVTDVDTLTKTIRFSLKTGYSLPGLPPGYFFKGGAAREQLRLFLSARKDRVFVRDYDLVRYMNTHDGFDHELSERFMSDDYEFGRGVEVVENKQIYFDTRDITQNEVLAWAGNLEASWQAVEDMIRGILRPTSYVTDRRGEVLSATVAKIYRFAAEFQIDGHKYRFADIPHEAFISPFSAALNLDRSFAKNEAVAREYIILVWERSRVFETFEVPPPLSDAVKHLAEKVTQRLALFKHLPLSVLKELTC